MTYEQVLVLWFGLPESQYWGSVDWVRQCVERPNIVYLGADEKNGGEVYAVIDMKASRILDRDEFSAEDVERLNWTTLEPRNLEPGK